MSLPISAMPNTRSRSRFRPGSRCLPPVRTDATSATNAASGTTPPTSSVALPEVPTLPPSGSPVELMRTYGPRADCHQGMLRPRYRPVVNGKKGGVVVTVHRRLEDETTSARLRRWAHECRQTARVSLSRSDTSKTGQIYDIIGTQNLFGEESQFINFGYWKNKPTTLDEASRDLGRLVAQSGDFNTSDIVVDSGTGYGDQDILWTNRYRREVDRLGWQRASSKAVRRTANVEAYRELLLDTGFAEAETQSIARDGFHPLARFLWKRLFAPDRKYVNPVLRLTVRPDNFWIHETHNRLHPGGGAQGVTACP
jgi:hypothetical protein